MRKRVFSSTILVFIVGLAIFSYKLCFVALLGFILVALWEFFNMIENKGVSLFQGVGLFLGAVIPITIFFKFPLTVEWQFMSIIAGLFALFILELTRKENYQTVLSISGTLFGVIYICWCLSSIIKIRALDDGAFLLAFLILVTKSSDLGAYFIGRKWGKRPLLKRVSPNKSLEGAFGGLVVSLIAGVVFNAFVDFFTLYQALFISFILAVIGELGDLFESLLKRDCGVKDSGRLLPGMGGVLDVVDSLIFTAPVFYIYLTTIVGR